MIAQGHVTRQSPLHIQSAIESINLRAVEAGDLPAPEMAVLAEIDASTR